jgi:hypothetical protein
MTTDALIQSCLPKPFTFSEPASPRPVAGQVYQSRDGYRSLHVVGAYAAGGVIWEVITTITCRNPLGRGTHQRRSRGFDTAMGIEIWVSKHDATLVKG